MFNFRAGSCIKGVLCEFCHVGHDRKSRRRGRAGKPKSEKINKGQTPDELEHNSFRADPLKVMLMTPSCDSVPSTTLGMQTCNKALVRIEGPCIPSPHALALQKTEVARKVHFDADVEQEIDHMALFSL